MSQEPPEPVDLQSVEHRDPADVVEMAVAIQANLVQLKVAQDKRLGSRASPTSGIRTPPPGPVKRFRETLILARQVLAYDDLGLALRLREVWGQHCLMCWFFFADDPQQPPVWRDMPPETPVRCPAAVAAKTFEIERCLWRLRFELRLREDPEFQRKPGFQDQYRAALDIPVMVMGQNIRVSNPENILLTSCEFAGMLAGARWVGNRRWTWAQEGIMDLPSDGQAIC